MSASLDILICTYNREDLLLGCIASLKNQNSHRDDWGIIVVNNYNIPFSKKTIASVSNLNHLVIINEPQPGLSIARNAGIKKSSAKWIGLLDDDARVPGNYIDTAFEIINTENFDCFGGHIQSNWEFGRPRWLPESYGSKPKLLLKRGIIHDDFNWGSNIFFKKSALIHVGCFPDHIGMSGNYIGYAAENLVQLKLRENGFIIGYDPSFHIDHIVLPEKLTLWWQIRAAFAAGRDGRKIFEAQYKFKGMLISFKNCFSKPAKAIGKFFLEKNFYWEMVLLETAKPAALLIGKLYALVRQY